MCDEWGDGTVLRRWFLTARKPHVCMACREPIAIGQRYHMDTTALDGTISVHKHCARCWAMVEALWRENGAVWVDFSLNCGETWENPPEEVAALAFALPRDFAGAP